MSDDDGLSSISWPEYTEEDFREIDRLCETSRQNDIGLDYGATDISIVSQRATDDGAHKIGEESQAANKSPFAEFRKHRGHLSVTDLVAPAWCEVQFDYGLRQFRSKPLERRPQSFVTTKGKEITVKKETAAKNEQVLDKGRTVHRKLEREVHKEEVPMTVQTKEENRALQLLDFLVRLKSSKTTSVCREVPVWGIIHGHAIIGVIDELRLETTVDPLLENSQTQTKLDSFVLNARKTMGGSPAVPQYVLHIVDNKTRYSPHLPSHVDTLPSRLQLMLYWLLLNQTLSGNGPSFSSFCAQTGTNPTREFSQIFISEMSALVLESELSLHFLDAKCIQDMDLPYRESIKDMGLDKDGCVNKRLSLVYRLRGRTSKKQKSASTGAAAGKENKLQARKSVSITVKDTPGQSAVAVDKADVKLSPPMDSTVDVNETTQENELPRDADGVPVAPDTSKVVSGEGSKAPSSQKRKRNTLLSSTSNALSTPETPGNSSVDDSDVSSSDNTSSGLTSFILGTKKFQYDHALLDAHLTSILAWWHGKRAPHGVSIEEAGRCNSCEYKNGCEWREQKAMEVLEKASTKSSCLKNGTVS